MKRTILDRWSRSPPKKPIKAALPMPHFLDPYPLPLFHSSTTQPNPTSLHRNAFLCRCCHRLLGRFCLCCPRQQGCPVRLLPLHPRGCLCLRVHQRKDLFAFLRQRRQEKEIRSYLTLSDRVSLSNNRPSASPSS